MMQSKNGVICRSRLWPMSKYAPLTDYLKRYGGDEWNVTFSEIEQILGFPLPPSASTHRTWWANHGGVMVHQKAWISAGWRVVMVDKERGQVRFMRQVTTQRRPPEPPGGQWLNVAGAMARVDPRHVAEVRRYQGAADLSVRLDWQHLGPAVRDGRSWRCPVIAAVPGVVRFHVFRRGLHAFVVRSARDLAVLARHPRDGSTESETMWQSLRMADSVLIDYLLAEHVTVGSGGAVRAADFTDLRDLFLAEAAAIAVTRETGLPVLGAA